MKFRGSLFFIFGFSLLLICAFGLIAAMLVYGDPQNDPAILQTCIIVFIGVVLPFLTGLLVSCTATIVDENGVCKALFHWRFNRMAWEEVAEIGVRYPYGVNHIMVQVYFSNLVTEDGKPIKPIGRKVKQRLVLLPYTKKFENYVLELAEMNPSIGKKFRDFPVVKDTAK